MRHTRHTPNFTDLRKGRSKRGQLIQDIMSPQSNHRCRNWRQLNHVAQNRSYLAFLGAGGVIISILIVSFLAPNNPLPTNIRSRINFVTFLSPKLPPKFQLVANSYSISNHVLTFVIATPNNQQILVSEQKDPPNFNVNSFQQGQIKDKNTVSTRYGTAYFGNLEDSQIGSLDASGTWVLLSEPKQVNTTSSLVALMKSLRKY